MVQDEYHYGTNTNELTWFVWRIIQTADGTFEAPGRPIVGPVPRFVAVCIKVSWLVHVLRPNIYRKINIDHALNSLHLETQYLSSDGAIYINESVLVGTDLGALHLGGETTVSHYTTDIVTNV